MALTPRVLAPMSPGQTATGVLTFDLSPPPDGAVVSDNPAICPVAIAADMITWTAGPALTIGVCTMSYTGTSVSPDVGPCVVAPVTITIEAAPVSEQGNFNTDSAVITGP